MRNLVITTLLFLNLSEAGACLAPTRPLEDAEYETIVLAEVVGVRLTGYAEVRWQEISDPNFDFYTDSSLRYEVEVLPVEILKGAASGKVTLSIGDGCAVPEARLRQVGLFYIGADGKASPILQNDREYSARLSKLGSRYGARCANEMEKRLPHPCPKIGQELAGCIRLLEEFGDAVAPSCPGVGRKIVERLEADLSSR
jgi:hypothetical protein